MLYSFWKILVTVFGCTLPWQLLAAHPPGPTYFPVTVPAVCGGLAASAGTASSNKAQVAIKDNRRFFAIVSFNVTPTLNFSPGCKLIRQIVSEINKESCVLWTREMFCYSIRALAVH
jgi:hypothetical protein